METGSGLKYQWYYKKSGASDWSVWNNHTTATTSAADPSVYELIGEHVLEEVQPRSSWRASKEFRLQLISELARRALREAMLSSLGNNLFA